MGVQCFTVLPLPLIAPARSLCRLHAPSVTSHIIRQAPCGQGSSFSSLGDPELLGLCLAPSGHTTDMCQVNERISPPLDPSPICAGGQRRSLQKLEEASVFGQDRSGQRPSEGHRGQRKERPRLDADQGLTPAPPSECESLPAPVSPGPQEQNPKPGASRECIMAVWEPGGPR